VVSLIMKIMEILAGMRETMIFDGWGLMIMIKERLRRLPRALYTCSSRLDPSAKK